jgi:hypothetical protein
MLLATAVRPPRFPAWPETRHPRATVVCEGPSACLASSEALRASPLDGPVVAVNRAIAFSDRIPFDAWATLDDPRHLWGWAQPHLHQRTKLFSSDGAPNILFWRDILGDANIGRLYTRQPTYMDELADYTEGGQAPMVPTLFHVLAWLLQVGVRHVRLVGCDMDGSGSPLAPTWDRKNDEGHVYRWQVEREFLRLSEKHYRARGARIERWEIT